MKTTFRSCSCCPLPQVGDEACGGVVTAIVPDSCYDHINHIEVETAKPIFGNTTLVVVGETSKGLLCRNGDDFYAAIPVPSPEPPVNTE
jgi:hypothetical protein